MTKLLAKPKSIHVLLSIAGLALVYGMIQGILKHSLAQFLFMLAGIMGCIGFWRNPHYLGSNLSSLPEDVRRSYDKTSHVFFLASRLLMLAGICAFAFYH